MWEAVLMGLYGIEYRSGLKVGKAEAGQANTYAKFFRKELEATPQEVRDFYQAWRDEHPKLSVPTTFETLKTLFPIWRNENTTKTDPGPGPANFPEPGIPMPDEILKIREERKANGQ